MHCWYSNSCLVLEQPHGFTFLIFRLYKKNASQKKMKNNLKKRLTQVLQYYSTTIVDRVKGADKRASVCTGLCKTSSMESLRILLLTNQHHYYILNILPDYIHSIIHASASFSTKLSSLVFIFFISPSSITLFLSIFTVYWLVGAYFFYR